MIPVWENVPDSAEFFPEGICEISPAFAGAKNIATGDILTVKSSSGSGVFAARVTSRIPRLSCGGADVDIVLLCGKDVRRIAAGPDGDTQYIPVEISVSGKRGVK
jgi:anaerobic selenocysteine-containing dehydrogenase